MRRAKQQIKGFYYITLYDIPVRLDPSLDEFSSV